MHGKVKLHLRNLNVKLAFTNEIENYYYIHQKFSLSNILLEIQNLISNANSNNL